jgi:hypothetical protein
MTMAMMMMTIGKRKKRLLIKITGNFGNKGHNNQTVHKIGRMLMVVGG